MSASQGHSSARLADAHVLVVEDELLLLLELETMLLDAGAAEVHLCRNVQEALNCVDHQPVSVAILDVRLGQDFVTPVAQRLTEHGTPFMFYTGQSPNDPLLAEWQRAKIVTKPARRHVILQALAELIGRPRS